MARQAEAAAPKGVTPGAGGATDKPRRGPGAFPGFLRASWAELQRVQWPDRRQVGQATGVVLGFVVVAGAYLGLADAVAQRIVDAIL
ncbi:MAG: preprotein translocase subunit SecE [Cellulomonas sp.]|nr:preprotein translocase subunit SecE [Cellulomonas sp.]